MLWALRNFCKCAFEEINYYYYINTTKYINFNTIWGRYPSHENVMLDLNFIYSWIFHSSDLSTFIQNKPGEINILRQMGMSADQIICGLKHKVSHWNFTLFTCVNLMCYSTVFAEYFLKYRFLNNANMESDSGGCWEMLEVASGFLSKKKATSIYYPMR